MGLVIRIHNVTCPNNFLLSYKIGGKTAAGNYTQYNVGANSSNFYNSSIIRNYNNDPILLTGATLDNLITEDETVLNRVWIKLQYTGVTGNVEYIIENIEIHQREYYSNCIDCCVIDGDVIVYTGCTMVGTAVTVINPTATPGPTPTSTPVVPTATPGPTATPVTPTATPVTPTATPVTPTATPVVPTATPYVSPGSPTATPTPTPTLTPGNTVRLYWSTNNNTGGQLLVTSNGGSEGDLLNEVSTSTTKSGYIDILESQCPYTIIGRWYSGSGNLVKFRICDVTTGSEIYTSPYIDNGFNYNSEESYPMGPPTPIVASVALYSRADMVPIVDCGGPL
jgi:hypothetical protein